MVHNLVTEEQVKKVLNISKFSEISKDKIMEFVSLIPYIDKDVAISIINQFPAYAEMATGIVSQLKTICENVLKENNSSQREAIHAYQKILDDLGELLKKEEISQEERDSITEKMILVADKISAKDTENKNFLNGLFKYGATILGAALVLGVTILGVNTRGAIIPTLRK